MYRRTVLGTVGLIGSAGCLRLSGSNEQDGAADSDGDRTDRRSSDVDRIELQEYNNRPVDIGNQDHREIRREPDALVLRAGDANADSGDIEGEMVEDEVSLGTAGVDRTIDLTAVDRIRVEYRHSSEGGREDYSYFGVDEELSSIRRSVIRDSVERGEPLVEAFLLTTYEPDTGRVTEFLDVSDITGPRNLGVGVQISSNFAQEVTLEVFEVTGLDAEGNEAFTVAIPGDES